ncbi:MAG: hypothetical protein ACE5D8_09240 [Fidelibacterota bacterium]
MNVLLTFLKRRWWLTQDRLYSTLMIMFMTPVIVFLFVHMPLNAIIVRSIRNISYGEWAYPGYLTIISFLGLLPTIYRDLFELRIHKKALLPITLTPVSKTEIVVGIVASAVVESIFFVVIAMVVFTSLMDVSFRWFDFLFIIVYMILQGFLIGNVISTISLLTKRVTTFIPLILIVMGFITFGTGCLLEFEFFPGQISGLLKLIPSSMLLENLRTVLFTRYFIWWTFITPLLITVLLTLLNGRILKQVLKQ